VVAPLGWSAAAQRDQPGLGRAIDFSGNRWAGSAIQRGLTFAHELLANPHDLPLANTHCLGNLPIPSATIRVVLVRH